MLPYQGRCLAHAHETDRDRAAALGERFVPSQGVWVPAGITVVLARWEGRDHTSPLRPESYGLKSTDAGTVEGWVRLPAARDGGAVHRRITVATGTPEASGLVQVARDCAQLLACGDTCAASGLRHAPDVCAIGYGTAAKLTTLMAAAGVAGLDSTMVSAVFFAASACLQREGLQRAGRLCQPADASELAHVVAAMASRSVAKVLVAGSERGVWEPCPATYAACWHTLAMMPSAGGGVWREVRRRNVASGDGVRTSGMGIRGGTSTSAAARR